MWIWNDDMVGNGELEVNVDNMIVMWIDYWEMMNWKWVLMNCFESDWIMCCYWEWCDYDICWVEDWDIELLMIKDWFELLWLWIEIVDMDWDDELCELFVLWMVMS